MKLKHIFIALTIGFTSIFVFSCRKDENSIDPQIQLNFDIMHWMYDEMDDVYYWNTTIPIYNSIKSETDPKVFFERLIYKPEDRWSWLTDDYAALMDEFAGTPTSMGIGSIPGRIGTSDTVIIIVTYVYSGSPADRAGIKRGDIIVKIDGQEMDTSNYYSLFNQESYSVNLGSYYNGTISSFSNSISLATETIDSNPVVFDTIFQFNNTKIGYLVYIEFISGENDALLNDFGNRIDEMKSQGVTDLILDLRYNPGGEISAANYLASCIAPATAVSDKNIFVKFKYNSNYQALFESRPEYSPYLFDLFTDNGHNLNLNRVFFLTGQRSASASELLIIGLKPYMEVVKIGEQTYGKYTGAWVITDNNFPPKHNWAIVPIVSKYSNSEDFTDFKDGLTPDYYIFDNLLQAKAFGDVADPILAKAIELITGQSLGIKKSLTSEINFHSLVNPLQSIKSNLYLEKPEF